MGPQNQIDEDKQKQILEALTQKYQDASGTQSVDNAVSNQDTSNLIANIGRALSTAASATTVSRGGQKADPTVFNMIAQQGAQGVQDARAKRQMAIDQAMKNIELNKTGLDQSMGIQSHNQGMQLGDLNLQKGQKDLAAADRKALQDAIDLKLGKQKVSAGNTALSDSDSNHTLDSNVTRLKQQIASQLVPGKDFSSNTGDELDQIIPQMKDLYDKQMGLKAAEQKVKTEGTPFSKEAEKQQAEIYAKGQLGLSKNQQNVDAIDDAINTQAAYTKNSTGGTGPIATGFGLKKFVDADLENLNAKFQGIDLKNMASTFAGMSKAIDSDAERRAWQGTQANIKNDDPTNMKILLGSKSILLKDQAEAAAQRAYVADKGNLDQYVSPVDGKVTTAVTPDGKMKLVPKATPKELAEQGLLTIDQYSSKLLKGGAAGPGTQPEDKQSTDTGFSHLSDSELQDRINKLKASK